MDAGDIRNLMRHVLRDRTVLANASDGRVRPEHFDERRELPAKLAWAVASEFYRSYSRLMPREYLEAEAAKRLSSPALQHVNRAAVQAELAAYYAVEDDLIITELGLDLLGYFLLERDVGDRLRDMADLRDSIERAHAAVPPPPVPLGVGSEPVLGWHPLTPLGVSFVDYCLGGGTFPGYLLLCVAPFKGGKTTLINQVALAQARSGKRAAVFVYETPIDPVWWHPVNAAISGIPKDRWAQISSVSQLTAAERTRWDEAIARVGGRFLPVDMTSATTPGMGRRGVDDLDDQIRRIEERHGKLDFAAVDWLGCMAAPAYDAYDVKYGKKVDTRVFYKGLMAKLKHLAVNRGLTLWVAHQCAPSEFRYENPRLHHASECKGLPEMIDGGLCLALRDHHDVCQLVGDACRHAPSHRDAFVQLQGNLAQFVHRDGQFRWSNRTKSWEGGVRRFVPVSESERPSADYAGQAAVED